MLGSFPAPEESEGDQEYRAQGSPAAAIQFAGGRGWNWQRKWIVAEAVAMVAAGGFDSVVAGLRSGDSVVGGGNSVVGVGGEQVACQNFLTPCPGP